MKLQEAIQKAIEGGWKPTKYVDYDNKAQLDGLTFFFDKFAQASVLLDPLFWQSLGKSLGWGRLRCVSCKEFAVPVRKVESDPEYWKDCCPSKNLDYGKSDTAHWHALIAHLAAGKTIETYFENLLDSFGGEKK